MLEEQWTIKNLVGASLMVQWLKICLLMWGAQGQTLVWEDPSCQGATEPMGHNYQSPRAASTEAWDPTA